MNLCKVIECIIFAPNTSPVVVIRHKVKYHYLTETEKNSVRKKLFDWFIKSHRKLPWRSEQEAHDIGG
jgi:hypothetical protein